MDSKDSARGRSRRGGFGDAGGLTTSNGNLPEALPVAVGTEAELRSELERVASLLAPAVDWTLRVDALLRLEGLVKGGAAGFAAFPELLLGLRDALASQMQERRSAVSRQACHAVSILAATCGPSFEPLATHLLPVVFKTLGMGIQVVSEAADACARSMLAHCPTPRLLPKLCSTVGGDRNGKLRQSASEYLLCALEGWQPVEYERQLDSIEQAVLAAAQDAQAETRALGRSLYGAYARAWPTQAQVLLARLSSRDKQLQEKLAQAAQEYVPGTLLSGPNFSQPPSRRSSLGNSGSTTPRGLSRSSSFPAGSGGVQQGGAVRLAPVVPKLALSTLSSAPDSGRGSPSHSNSARTAVAAAHSHSARSAAAPGSLVQAAVWQQPATARENQPDNRAAPAVQATPRSMFPKTFARREAAATAEPSCNADAEPSRQPAAGRERLMPRRSLGGAALRMSIASFRRQQEPDDAAEEVADDAAAAPLAAAQRGIAGPMRVSLRLPVPQPADSLEQPPQSQEVSARSLTARRVGPSSIPEDPGAEPSSRSGGFCEEAASSAASLAPLLAGLTKQGVSWSERVALFQSIEAAMQQSGSSQHAAADAASNADRLTALLLEGAGDAHFRVASAALGALAAGLASPSSRIFEPQLDRVMTTLFARVVDPKEQIRQLVGTALSAVLQQHSADAIVSALARSLQANRAPKVKCAVMDFFAAAAAGTAHPQRSPLVQQLVGSALGGLLRSLLHLTTDKNPDIRRAAVAAVAAAYHSGEAQSVLAAVHNLPPADCLAVQRAIGPALQQAGNGEAAPPGGAARGGGNKAAASGAGSQQSGSMTSRRQSGEGLRQAVQQRTDSGSLTSRRHSSEGVRQPRAEGGSLTSRRQSGEGLRQQRPENGSLTARSRPGSNQAATSPLAGRQQAAAAAVVPATAAGPAQLTPEPPSPFTWRGQSSSPLPAAAAAAAGAQPDLVLPEQHLQQSAPAGGAAVTAATTQAQSGSRAAPPAHGQAAAGECDARPAPPLQLSELAPFDDVMAGQLQRLVAQLEQGLSSEALQNLSRMAHVLPAAAWPGCFEQVMAAVCAALDSSSPVVRDAGLMLMRDLAAAAQPSLFLPALPALLPKLLACAAEQDAREVAVAADEALEQLLQRAPPQTCLGLLAPQLPASGSQLSVDRQQGAELHAVVRSLHRVVSRMQPAGLAAHLQPLLMPGLCMAYRSPLADVRKATVECLVSIWQVVGDAIKPHLEPLSASQMKLLTIYYDKARARG